MRRAIYTLLIWTLLLASCGTFDVTLTTSDALTQTPSTDSSAPATAPLGMDSSSEQIRQTLLDSPFQWRTIFMDAQVTSVGEAPRRVQAWVDQPALSLRVLSGPPEGSAETFRVADGMSLLELDLRTGKSSLSPFLGETISLPYTPQPPNMNTSVGIEPHPLSTAVDAALGTLLFPSDIAQNEGNFKPIAMEVLAYKLVLVVEWRYIQNDLPSYRAWVDISTGLFLRLQQFEKSGGTDVLSEVTVTRVDYDLPFSPDLFSPVVYVLPDFVNEPQMPVIATVPPAATFSGTDPLGMVYAFVSDNLYPVPHIRLVRVPASCALRVSSCPQAEVIEPPAPLVYSIPPLVWSPTHDFAAFAYPIKENGNSAALFLFDPKNNSWKSLAEFAFIDPPKWSRDGTWLAFRVQDGEGGSEVYAIRRNGNDLKHLTASDKLPAEGQPYIMDAWLGENVILRSAKPGQPGTLYLMRVEDGTVKPLFDTLLTKSALIESPDGMLLAYVDYDYASQKQLVKLMTPDGNTLRDLATFATPSILGLAWSPDGTQLAFSHVVDATSVVYVIDSDGRNLRQVYSGDSGTGFLFSPDGKTLLIQTMDGTGQHLYTIDLTSLEARLVLVPGIGLNETWMQPAWQP